MPLVLAEALVLDFDHIQALVEQLGLAEEYPLHKAVLELAVEQEQVEEYSRQQAQVEELALVVEEGALECPLSFE